MAGAAIHFDIGTLPGIERALMSAHKRSLDLAPLMDQIGNAMEVTTHERFESESDPDGNPWKQSIRARTEGGKTLTKDGHLDNSITHSFTADSAEIGSNLIYAGIHQQGGRISGKSGNLRFQLPGALGFRSVESVLIPARPFLGLGGDDEMTIGELTGDYLLGELQ